MKFFNIEYNIAIKISLIFLPLFLIFSRFLADFYISLLSLYFIFSFFFYNKINFEKNNLYKFLIIFYLYLLFNSFFSFDILTSFKKSIPYFRFIFYSILLVIIFSKNKSSLDLLIKSFIFSHTILFLDSSFQFIFGYNFFGETVQNGRISSFFSDELILGSYVSKTLPIILSLFFLNKEKYSLKFEYYIICISLLMAFYSAERVGFISCCLMSFFYFFIRFNLKKFIIFFIIFIISISLLSIFSSKTYNRLFTHTLKQIQSSTVYFSPSFRHELHAHTALNMFKDKFLLGHGLYSFRYLCDKDKYIPKEKIKKNNYFKSPTDGIFKKNEFGYFLELENGELIQLSQEGFYFYEASDKINKKVSKDEILFSNYAYKNGCNTHPHNYYLQFLAEIGIIGFLFLLSFLFYIVFEILKNLKTKFFNSKKYNDLSKGYLCILFGLLLFVFPLFPTGNFFNNWISIIFYTNLSIFLLYNTKLNQ